MAGCRALTPLSAHSPPQAIAPLLVLTGAMVPLLKLGQLASLKSAIGAASRLFALFDQTPAIDSFSEAGQTPEAVAGEIEVRDVVFAYPTAPDHLVCNGYSLSVSAGQTVALCGASGSGKSTLVALLERFYDPQGGAILLDGVDLRDLNVRWLRAQLGLVGQEPVLFQGSVADNIRYGKAGASDADVEGAARLANAHGFITSSLADGYATQVGLKGGRLSGGQKQRVAIARAIVRKPAVLLLDEATSALDNESERVVQAALDAVVAETRRTTLVIAHRLSTIRNADSIAVLSEGRVVEKGSFEELVSRPGGVFAKLAKEQEELLKEDRATIASAAGDEGGDSLSASGPVAAALEPPPASTKEGEDGLGLARVAPLPREALGPLRRLLRLQARLIRN